MQNLLSFILDFFFPPSAEVLKLRTLSPMELIRSLPPASPPPFPFITSVFAYKNPLVSELISSIKNKKDGHAIHLGAYALIEKLKDEKVVLIPIPISKKRRRERGFNQCELLINEMCAINSNFDKKFDILVRPKDGGEQKLKDRASRLEIRNIFTVHFLPTGKPIVLIDDVTTTGATLHEARGALLKAGYRDVRAITLAH